MMKTLLNAPFSKRKALFALLLAPFAGLSLVVFLPLAGFMVTGKALLDRVHAEARGLRRKGRRFDAGAA
jgi:hypothetical protein